MMCQARFEESDLVRSLSEINESVYYFRFIDTVWEAERVQ